MKVDKGLCYAHLQTDMLQHLTIVRGRVKKSGGFTKETCSFGGWGWWWLEGLRIDKKYLIDIYLLKVFSGSQEGCKCFNIYTFF